MKYLLLLFFAFTLPVLLFLANILYGDTSTSTLKANLRNMGTYNQLSKTFAQKDVKNADGGELYGNFVTKRFQPEYIQLKAEDAIDQSSAWITGKTQSEPVVNFKELKDDMARKYPFFIKALQNDPSKQEMISYGLNEQQQQEFLMQRAGISDFVKNDFSFALGHYLEGIKKFYSSLVYTIPILIIFLILALIFITIKTKGGPAKLNWLGVTFLISAFIGYGLIYFRNDILTVLTYISIFDKASYLAFITPVLIAVLKFYMDSYVAVQSQANVVLLVVGGICFLGAIVMKFVAKLNLNKQLVNKPQEPNSM